MVDLERKLVVYAESGHANKNDWLRYLVHPVRAFWGDGTDEWENWKTNFQFYKNYFLLTDDVSKSEIGFLPLTLNYYINNKKLSLVNQLAEKMKIFNKVLIAWLDGDQNIRYEHDNCIIIKYSSNQNKNNANVFIQPADLRSDLLKEYFNGKLKIKKKKKIPSLGFDGMADYPIFKMKGTIIKNIFHHISYSIFKTQFTPDPIFPILLKRKYFLSLLNNSSLIKTDFNIRNSFAFGLVHDESNARNEYINNIISNDYTFCYRGNANYSLRLYETLCLGRIPLFIDTDCVLPLMGKINWKEICLWVDQSEIEFIDKKILDYHQSMNSKEYTEKQLYCREVWLKYFSKEGFIKYLYQFLIHNKSIDKS